MKRKPGVQAGFSLAELLVAIVILAIGLLGLAEMQVTAMRVNARGSHLEAAASLAQMVVEDVINREPNDTLFRTARSHADWATWGASPVTVAGAGVYKIEIDTEPAYEGVDNLCKITVYVKSTSRFFGLGSQSNPLTLVTIKRFTPA